jgi:hypothetical protein
MKLKLLLAQQHPLRQLQEVVEEVVAVVKEALWDKHLLKSQHLVLLLLKILLLMPVMQDVVVEKEQERVAAMYALILILVENLEAQAPKKAWVVVQPQPVEQQRLLSAVKPFRLLVYIVWLETLISSKKSILIV